MGLGFRSTESSAPVRATEATIDQLIATGAAGTYGIDPIDGDAGFVRVGQTGRQIPLWTREKMRAYSVAAYRLNPMARAVIDTYVAFAVGDSGLTIHAPDPAVHQVCHDFWHDPKVRMHALQERHFRQHLLYGETLWEMLIGPSTGVCRVNPIDPTRIVDVRLAAGNVLWPTQVLVSQIAGEDIPLELADVDDVTGLRVGDGLFFADFNALVSDQRGDPFLSPILDDLDSFDMVLNNLIDRTSLARYMVWDVEVDGDDKVINKYLEDRGGTHVPRSGAMEVHNKSVKWTPMSARTEAAEDTITTGAILTNVAGGAGLAKTWLAEPDGANRATSISMAEPVRRRVGSVQNAWLHHQTETLRFVVDQAVRRGQLPKMVSLPATGGEARVEMTAAQSVSVHGPEVAAADSQVTAAVLVQLAQSMVSLVASGVMTPAAARLATKKAWEQFVGVPYTPELDQPDGSKAEDLAELIDQLANSGNLKISLKL